MKKKPMVILTGPTAVGKSALSIALAKKINAEIISADSMQVYRHMDIGSAKITPEEMCGIPHYLIDELEPAEEFHVVRFVELAKQHMEAIYAKGKIPLIVGGTGFYIQALLYDIDFTEQECDEAYRSKLECLADEKGVEYLHEMLREVDQSPPRRSMRTTGSVSSVRWNFTILPAKKSLRTTRGSGRRRRLIILRISSCPMTVPHCMSASTGGWMR